MSLALPVYILTALFGAGFLFGPLFVKRGPNALIIKTCIMLTCFSCWLFWVTIYIAQMNPLIRPEVKTDIAAWISYRWVRIASA